ncbi:MAG: MBL fold metallo-hydrolase [Acidobacteriota bacterium]|nr:MBL fold metallo-hydrolase [Acidobacteriota bacterium]
MDNKEVFLKRNIVAEPLINRWYAWPNLISPATSSIYMENYQLKVMESFVAAPQIHEAAYKNPAMLGGPFINYPSSRVGEIKKLIQKTKAEQSQMYAFANAVKALHKMLETEAKGFSLEPLYEKVPDLIKGYVELIYDVNHRPSFRFLEGLLYRSPYYDRASQGMAFHMINEDFRPFVFSTPRLEDDNLLHLQIPFESEALDTLFRMTKQARPLGYIKELLGINGEDSGLFESFFTEQPPEPSPAAYCGEKVRIRYINHACLLIEAGGISILTDPILSYHLGIDDGRVTFQDLPDQIDYVVISHNHQDHAMFETLLQIRHKVKSVIVPKSSGNYMDISLKMVMEHAGFKNVLELDEMAMVSSDPVTITSVPFLGEHCDLNIRSKAAYVIQALGKTIFVGADSCNLEPRLYGHFQQIFGDFDAVFLGMECDGAPLSWMYGPLLFSNPTNMMNQSRKLNGSNFDQAAGIVASLNPKRVFVYAMGMEPWLVYLTSLSYVDDDLPIVESSRLLEHCKNRDIDAERLSSPKLIVLD